MAENNTQAAECLSHLTAELGTTSDGFLIAEMALTGEIKKDRDATFFGDKKPSRGYYIVIPKNGTWYLHHDGIVKNGVNADSKKPAFWPTYEDAMQFFNAWKCKQLGV
jgi:hypothetical protein